jgi:hypothetical protein
VTALGSRLTDAAADVAASAFGAVARIRHRKPLHPRGVVVPARVERTGTAAPWGAAWLDDTEALQGMARLSRSAGFPDRWPDVWGLALRLDLPDARTLADLLLSSGWANPLGRHALALRRTPRPPFTTVMPYRTASGRSVMLAALGPAAALPSDRGALAVALEAEPLHLPLAAAVGSGGWQPYGVVVLGGPAVGSGDGLVAGDADISFDPMINPLPGLSLPEPVATIRSRAYAGARARRGASTPALRTLARDVPPAAPVERLGR